ncbi:MAG TPA: hypothetical protein VHQ22_02085, partial [Terriglobales bacterium]|nr:hypothetical protein [Terriglobales bacterium]
PFGFYTEIHMQKNEQFDRFKDAMTRLMRVPHSEVKEKLDAEKDAKKLKRTRKSKLAAVRALNDTVKQDAEYICSLGSHQ